jgi:hypothetical protein
MMTIVVNQTPPRMLATKTRSAGFPGTWGPDRFRPLAVLKKGRRSSRVPKFIEHRLQGNSDVMTRSYHGLDVKPTVFSPYWVPQDRDPVDQWLQHLVDVTSVHKTYNLGHGIRLHCTSALLGFGVVVGCSGDPPAPPSVLSDDPRLSMAPAKPLVPGIGSPRPSRDRPAAAATATTWSRTDAARCQTARMAGAPLPPGCGRLSEARFHALPSLQQHGGLAVDGHCRPAAGTAKVGRPGGTAIDPCSTNPGQQDAKHRYLL